MIPIVLVSFRRGRCVAKKICLAQYIPLAVSGLLSVTASRLHGGKIMAEVIENHLPDCDPKKHLQLERKKNYMRMKRPS